MATSTGRTGRAGRLNQARPRATSGIDAARNGPQGSREVGGEKARLGPDRSDYPEEAVQDQDRGLPRAWSLGEKQPQEDEKQNPGEGEPVVVDHLWHCFADQAGHARPTAFEQAERGEQAHPDCGQHRCSYERKLGPRPRGDGDCQTDKERQTDNMDSHLTPPNRAFRDHRGKSIGQSRIDHQWPLDQDPRIALDEELGERCQRHHDASRKGHRPQDQGKLADEASPKRANH